MTIFGIIFFITLLTGLIVTLYKYFEDTVNVICLSAIIFTTIILTILFSGLINIKFEKSNKIGVTYISSLTLNSNIEGNFFLGSGTIENKNYYIYMSNRKLGYRLSKIEITKYVYIKEDCNEKPYIEFRKYETSKLNPFTSLFVKKHIYNKKGETIIHVPNNTVIKKYNVDINQL